MGAFLAEVAGDYTLQACGGVEIGGRGGLREWVGGGRGRGGGGGEGDGEGGGEAGCFHFGFDFDGVDARSVGWEFIVGAEGAGEGLADVGVAEGGGEGEEGREGEGG